MNDTTHFKVPYPIGTILYNIDLIGKTCKIIPYRICGYNISMTEMYFDFGNWICNTRRLNETLFSSIDSAKDKIRQKRGDDTDIFIVVSNYE